MNANENNRNGSVGLTHSGRESSEPAVLASDRIRAPEPIDGAEKAEPVTRFATRTAVKGAEGISKGKLMLLGGGLAVAVLFFVFTAVVGKSPKKLAATKPQSQQAGRSSRRRSKGSVTPLMDTVRTPAPDNSSGQLGPGDIRRTRTARQWLNREAVRRQACCCHLPGQCALFCRHAAEMGRSGTLRRRLHSRNAANAAEQSQGALSDLRAECGARPGVGVHRRSMRMRMVLRDWN